MVNKYCSHCKSLKSQTEFARNRSKYDGLQSYCKSCMAQYGSLYLEKRRLNSKIWRRSALGRYRKLLDRGRRKGVLVDITQDLFISWFNSQAKICHYCGVILTGYHQDGYLQGLTIDRKDNNKSYEMGNMVLSCQRCNIMKGSWLNEKQMLDMAQRYFRGNKGEENGTNQRTDTVVLGTVRI